MSNNMGTLPDIDIDMKNRNDILDHLRHIPASMIQNKEYKKHLAGVYFQKIPQDYITGLSSITYKEAEELGYVKMDFLHNTVYNNIKSREQLKNLVQKEPDWNLLKDKEIVSKLFHIGNYYDLLQKLPVNSVEELAMFIAIIRPGKKPLQKLGDWNKIKNEIWKKDSDGYQFKKSHAISYALVIVVQLNQIT